MRGEKDKNQGLVELGLAQVHRAPGEQSSGPQFSSLHNGHEED